MLAGLGLAAAVAVLAGRWALVLAVPVGVAGWWLVRRMARRTRAELDPPSTALVLDLISAALSSGLPVPSAIEAVDRAVSSYGNQALAAAVEPFRLVGRLQLLGEEPVQAWSQLATKPGLRSVAAAGRRCAYSGARLAGALSETAAELRVEHQARALRRAQRTGVWALLPLGFCFLPAFVCLGVIPVVLGVARQVFGNGLSLR